MYSNWTAFWFFFPDTPVRLLREVVLLTDDRNLRLKAHTHNVPVKDIPAFMKWSSATWVWILLSPFWNTPAPLWAVAKQQVLSNQIVTSLGLLSKIWGNFFKGSLEVVLNYFLLVKLAYEDGTVMFCCSKLGRYLVTDGSENIDCHSLRLLCKGLIVL